MADHDPPGEGLRELNELFGSDPSEPPSRGCSKYVLDYLDGEPVFRRADSRPVPARDEIELALDQIIDEVFDNDVVPRKLAYLFPGSTFEPWHRTPPLAAVFSLRRFS
jgi:hypothetical protein